ncbi:UPF0481 protein At3g47200-like [Musa acuminata AAA Group]|uniref:UPF0481 protein At3g47200-like n=1 Tax=Musa acuminata AAA Group TaxID=214697 RepID=UPI0031D5520E
MAQSGNTNDELAARRELALGIRRKDFPNRIEDFPQQNREISLTEGVPWARYSIYRVPKSLREGDEKAYMPQVVSIGPYHHGKRRLRDMERHKWRALHRMLRRTGGDVRVYLDAVGALEERARACYEGPIAFNDNEFVEMMVLDGTFVLELFRGVGAAGKGFKELGYARNDPVFAMRGTMHGIQRDMIML